MENKQPPYDKKQLNFKQLKNNLINQNDTKPPYDVNTVNNEEVEGILYSKYSTPVREKSDNYSIGVSGGSYSNQFTNPREKILNSSKK